MCSDGECIMGEDIYMLALTMEADEAYNFVEHVGMRSCVYWLVCDQMVWHLWYGRANKRKVGILV